MFEIFGLGAEFLFNASGTERIVNVVSELERLDLQVRTTGTGMDQFNQQLLEFSGAMANAGGAMIAKGMTQVYAAMKGVQAAGEWETQMVNAVRYMSDDSAEAQTRYNQTLAETAKLLGKSKEEINESVVAYMMMGKSSDEALRLSKNAGYAAVAWDMTAGQVADSFRTIKAAFNVNLEDQAMYQKYLDTINEVGNSTAATAADVVAFLSDGGSALHNVANVSMEQAMGMASAARYANMSIAEFSTMMIRLGNQYASDKSTKYFKSLGIEVKEADGSMRSFAEVLYDVQKQWNDLDQATKSQFASGVGGVYADRLSLYMGSGEEYKKGSEIAGQDNTGSAEAEFSRVTNTYQMAMARLKVTTSDFMTAFWGTLLPPLKKFINIVTSIIDKISGFMQAHPAIMKVAAGFILLSGIAITLGGAFMLVSAMLVKFITTVKMGNGPVSMLTASFRGLKIALSSIEGPTKLALKNFGKLTVTMGILYAAWKYDLFGIRTALTDFLSKMQYSLTNTKQLLSDNMPVDQFNAQIKKLEASESIWDKLTLIMTKFGMVWKGVTQAWNSYELSDSMYEKLKAAGLLETVTFILLVKMRLDAFFAGIKEGFLTTLNAINDVVQKVLKPPFEFLLNKVILPLANAFLGAGNSIEVLCGKANAGMSQDILDRWKAFGEIVGSFAAVGLAFASVAKVIGILSKVGTVIGMIVKVIGGIGSAVSAVWGLIAPILSGALSAITGIFTGIAAVTGLPVIAVVGIIAAVAAVIVALTLYRDQIVTFFQNLWSNITTFVSNIGTSIVEFGQSLMQIGWINSLVTGVQNAFGFIVNIVKTAANIIAGIFTPIINVIKVLWNNLSSWFGMLWNQTVEKFSSIWGHITELVQNVVDGVVSTWNNIVAGVISIKDKVVEVFAPIIQNVMTFAQTVVDFVGFVLSAISGIGNAVLIKIQPIIDVVIAAWDVMVSVVGGVLNTLLSIVMGIFSTIWSYVSGVVTGIANTVISIVTAIWNTLVGVLNAIWNTIVGVVNGIVSFVGGAINLVFGTISNVLMAIMNFIMGNTDAAKQNIIAAGNAIWTGISGILSGIWGVISSVFSGIWNTILSIGGGILEAIKSPFVSAWEFIQGFISDLGEVGGKIIGTIVDGINAVKDRIYETVSGIFSKVRNLLPFSDAKEGPFSDLTASGKAILNTISSGIKSVKEGFFNTVSGVFSKVRELLPFSDAKTGPFSDLTKSGMAIPGTIATGVEKNADSLYNAMSSTSDNAMSALAKDASMKVGVNGYLGNVDTRVLDKPISAQLTETQNLVDNRANDYYEAVLIRLDMIANAVSSVSIEPTLSNDYAERNYDRVERIQTAVAEQKASSVSLNIQSGAIQIQPIIQGGDVNDAERVAEIVREMMESDIFPFIMSEMQRISELKNERR